MSEKQLQQWRDMDEDELKPSDIIPWCSKDFTLKQSKKECPLGGCWKYRCYDSKLNPTWSRDAKAWRKKRYGRLFR